MMAGNGWQWMAMAGKGFKWLPVSAYASDHRMKGNFPLIINQRPAVDKKKVKG